MMLFLGSPTVLLAGPAANRFIFSNVGLILTQTSALRALVGRSVPTLAGEELKQVRGALQGCLRPEMVARYVRTMDDEVRTHIELNWVSRNTVTVLPTVRSLSLGIICSVVFGPEEAPLKEALAADFVTLGKAILSSPFCSEDTIHRVQQGYECECEDRESHHKHCPQEGSHFCVKAMMFLVLTSSPTCSLNAPKVPTPSRWRTLRIIGSHETITVLITFIIRYLANEPDVLYKVTEEQEEIAWNKIPEVSLTWNDVAKMRYTWKVAMETMRTIPPVFGSFRTATKDIEYLGYHIPKGWKVFAAQSVTHMDANLFHEPSKFDPSWFEKSVPPYCYMPFGGGPRMYPGNEFARVETMVVMHCLVRQLWKMICKEETYKRDPKATPVFGLPIELKLRGPPANATS